MDFAKSWCKSLYNFYYCRYLQVTLLFVGGVKAFIISTIVDKQATLMLVDHGVKAFIISTIVDSWLMGWMLCAGVKALIISTIIEWLYMFRRIDQGIKKLNCRKRGFIASYDCIS